MPKVNDRVRIKHTFEDDQKHFGLKDGDIGQVIDYYGYLGERQLYSVMLDNQTRPYLFYDIQLDVIPQEEN